MTTRVRNDLFDSHHGYQRGRSVWVFALWHMTKFVFFGSFPWPSPIKVTLLRAFGAKIGERVVVRPRANIHSPWRLTIRDYAWVGEEVLILNFEPVTIGSHACISQRTFLCTGNHDFRDPSMPYRNRSITIEDGAWVGAMCFVAPGVTIHLDAVVRAGSVVLKDVPAGVIAAGNPCESVGLRWKNDPALDQQIIAEATADMIRFTKPPQEAAK